MNPEIIISHQEMHNNRNIAKDRIVNEKEVIMDFVLNEVVGVAMEIIQWGMHLLYKHENLNLGLQHPCKMVGMEVPVSKPSAGHGGRYRQIPGISSQSI